MAGAVVPGELSRDLSVSSAGESAAITQVNSAVMNRLGRSTVVNVPESPIATSPPVAVKLTSAGWMTVTIGPIGSGHGVLPVSGSVSISPGSALVAVKVPIDVAFRPFGKSGFSVVANAPGTVTVHV